MATSPGSNRGRGSGLCSYYGGMFGSVCSLFERDQKGQTKQEAFSLILIFVYFLLLKFRICIIDAGNYDLQVWNLTNFEIKSGNT